MSIVENHFDAESAISLIKNAEIFFLTSLYGSSGGYFLNSLFDNHDEVFTFPWPIAHYIKSIDFEDNKMNAHVNAILNDEIFFDTSLGNATVRGDSLHMLGDNKDSGIKINKTKFSTCLKELLSKLEFNAKHFTLSVVLSYQYCLYGRNNLTSKFVLYTHDMKQTLEFKELFKTGKIIAIARHPANTMISGTKQYYQKAIDRNKTLSPYAYIFKKDQTFLYENLNMGIVLLEELHYNPESSMKKLAKFMDITFKSTLLESTFGGLKWWGIRVSILNGFSKTLHNKVNINFLGKNDECAIFLLTKELQFFLNYSSANDCKTFEKIRAFLPGKLFVHFYKNLIKTCIKKKNTQRLQCVKYFLFYPLYSVFNNYKVLMENLTMKKRSFSNFEIINPLDSKSLERIR